MVERTRQLESLYRADETLHRSLRLEDVLQALDGKQPKHVGDELATARPLQQRAFPASNSHAVASWRSSDGKTRLNINSHQPWEGPVTSRS